MAILFDVYDVGDVMNRQTLYRWLNSPLGPIQIAIHVTPDGATLAAIEFLAEARLQHPDNLHQHPLLDLAQTQLAEYFSGQRQAFTELVPFIGEHGTPFQREVWGALIKINHGDTCSYADIAKTINNPKAVRAVGAANGKNPLAIVVPCHRVIGANGTLTGYAGGLDKKQWLLTFEQQQLALI